RVFDTAKAAAPGEVYVLGGRLSLEAVTGLMSGLRILPRAAYLVPDERISLLLQNSVHGVGGTVALEMQKAPMTRTERLLKRIVDIAIACAALAFLLPLLVGIAIAILLDSRGPILFRQQRLGYQGRPFRILKFRTMTVLEDGDDVRQASPNDLRVTSVGRWLRRSSLDELPQLWNVLCGEMSIVGPRCGASTGYSRSDRVGWWAALIRYCHVVDANCSSASRRAALRRVAVRCRRLWRRPIRGAMSA